MKKLFTLLAFMVGVATMNAQNLIIHHKGGNVTKIAMADIDFMEVADDMTELVEFNVTNMGRFSFDVEVKKSNRCTRYIVGASTANIYKEENFIEAAQQTLDENAFFRPYIDGVATTSQTFSERQLGINAVVNYDKDTKEDIYTVVAIYAEDAAGNYKVYSQTFLIPNPTIAAKPTVTLEASNIATENFQFTITASSDCKKVIFGIASPEGLNGKEMSAKLMTEVSQGLPKAYDGPITINVADFEALQPNSTYYPYVIPIAADGTIGQTSFITVKTAAVTANGTGRILSASGTLQSEGQYRSIACPTMTFNADVEKVRIMFCSDTDFSSYKDRLVEVFAKDSYKNMAWTEYPVGSLPRTLPVYHYSNNYYLYAATVDKNGGVSEAQDILALMGVDSPYYTNAQTDIVPAITFDGTATANIVNDDKEIKYSPYFPDKITEINPWFTVEPGQNLSHVAVMRIDIDATNVKKAVESILVGYPNYEVGFTGAKCDLIYANGTWTVEPEDALDNLTIAGSTLRFKERWLSYEKLVFVTIDTNGRPKIHSVYTPTETGGELKPF